MRLGLYPPKQDEDNKDHKHNAKSAHAAVAEAIAISAKPSTETAKQGNDEQDDKDRANCHEYVSPKWSPSDGIDPYD